MNHVKVFILQRMKIIHIFPSRGLFYVFVNIVKYIYTKCDKSTYVKIIVVLDTDGNCLDKITLRYFCEMSIYVSEIHK